MNAERKIEIISQYDNLIKNIAYKYKDKVKALNDMEMEDLISEIKLNLFIKLDNLDESKGFASYIKNIINSTCVNFFRSREREKRSADFNCDSLDKRIATIDSDTEDTLLNLIGSDYNLENESIEDIFVKEIFNFAKENCTENAYQILCLWYKGYSFTDIAKIKGVSKQRINQVFNRTIRKIHTKFMVKI